MTHPTVFLVGLHGTGKSTIGRYMSKTHGWCHISLGDIGRLARSGQRPSEFSLRLITEMSVHKAGQRLGQRLLEAIQFEIVKQSCHRPVVCDGFPAKTEHIGLLPANSLIVHLECSAGIREARLDHRAANTKRQWTNGMLSERDADLPSLVEYVRSGIQFPPVQYMNVNNDCNGLDALKAITTNLAEHFLVT